MVYRGEGKSSCQPPLSVRCDTKAAACPEQQHSSIDNDIICQVHERLPIGLRRSLTKLAATELLQHVVRVPSQQTATPQSHSRRGERQ